MDSSMLVQLSFLFRPLDFLLSVSGEPSAASVAAPHCACFRLSTCCEHVASCFSFHLPSVFLFCLAPLPLPLPPPLRPPPLPPPPPPSVCPPLQAAERHVGQVNVTDSLSVHSNTSALFHSSNPVYLQCNVLNQFM